jgi:hypothetical protein
MVMRLLISMRWNRHLVEFRIRDNREAMGVSIVATSQTKRRKQRWWQSSSKHVRPMSRERSTIQSL